MDIFTTVNADILSNLVGDQIGRQDELSDVKIGICQNCGNNMGARNGKSEFVCSTCGNTMGIIGDIRNHDNPRNTLKVPIRAGRRKRQITSSNYHIQQVQTIKAQLAESAGKYAKIYGACPFDKKLLDGVAEQYHALQTHVKTEDERSFVRRKDNRKQLLAALIYNECAGVGRFEIPIQNYFIFVGLEGKPDLSSGIDKIEGLIMSNPGNINITINRIGLEACIEFSLKQLEIHSTETFQEAIVIIKTLDGQNIDVKKKTWSKIGGTMKYLRKIHGYKYTDDQITKACGFIQKTTWNTYFNTVNSEFPKFHKLGN